jgi:hypothetical protein
MNATTILSHPILRPSKLEQNSFNLSINPLSSWGRGLASLPVGRGEGKSENHEREKGF